jgi:hypothetical protein
MDAILIIAAVVIILALAGSYVFICVALGYMMEGKEE